MIIATIQSKITGGSHPSTTALNGKLLSSDEAQPHLNRLYEIIDGLPPLDSEQIVPISDSRYLLCVQDHPERDEAGRIRPALVLWSDDESLESIKSTLQAMGLEIARFSDLYREYQAAVQARAKAQAKAKQNKRVLLVAGVVAAFALIYLLKK
ncbi:hypothetical protein [Helicobacter zhangjianzhongii]|uniref:Uncharacterized protein n=1 Tax=Helicobacter zhangjianzhongii TaxID=2974574 RepID=A0ACC6FTB2_9HELI|nr:MULTISPECIES: hypothetical protein [unclassified Helicobacter]MDL0080463.1 hypothetical protein [Helicobacter sp. CPD2-1]MDL0082385.1 hypothetical protein [Helicobacter sp. XJK30-2]